VAGGNFTHGFAAREFPRGLRQGGDMAAVPLARSRIPPATQAIQAHDIAEKGTQSPSLQK